MYHMIAILIIILIFKSLMYGGDKADGNKCGLLRIIQIYKNCQSLLGFYLRPLLNKSWKNVNYLAN